MHLSSTRLFTSLCTLAATASAVTPIEVDGKDFVNSKTKDRFQIIGVDYQPGGAGGFSTKQDPLSQPKACLRDAALMQRLGINTIRIYNLSPTLDHDECASIFNAAGIYMILDVNSPLPGDNLDRTDPKGSYHEGYFKQAFGIIEAFKDYPNTLALFAGNEVINEQAAHEVPAFVRATQRDLKDYIAKHASRPIPVGYSAADVRNILMDTVNYFQCNLGDHDNSRSDFFGLNSYSWCGDSNMQKSGYDVLAHDFANASLPVFFSEYGCNAVEPRIFSEVQALYSQEMSQAFSGGLVYEYTMGENGFGLVKVKDNGDAVLTADYENLQKQYGKLDMDRISTSNGSHTDSKPVKCSSDLISSDKFLKSFDLPERPGAVQGLIEHGCPFIKAGKIVDVKSKPIPQTVFDQHGREVTDIRLDVVKDDQANDPRHASPTHGKDEGDKHKNEDKSNDNKGIATSISNSNVHGTDSTATSTSDSTNAAYYNPDAPNAAGSLSSSMLLSLLAGIVALFAVL